MELSNQIASMEAAFGILNERLFDGELHRPVITIYANPGTYGHFTPWKSWDDSATGEGREEINLSADQMNRDLIDIMATLVHEMCHLYCHMHGIKDTSRQGRYHNANFKAVAIAHGLRCRSGEHYGFHVTNPGRALLDMEAEGCFETVRHDLCRKSELAARVGGEKTGNAGGQPTRARRKQHRYECPSCGAWVRSTKEVHVMCADCERDMEEVEK